MAKSPVEAKAYYEPEYNDRIFVRLILGGYALKEEHKKMREAPRVLKAKELSWSSGPQLWQKSLVTPATSPVQSLYMHIEDFAPGARSQKHGHQNEAMFFILDGKGKIEGLPEGFGPTEIDMNALGNTFSYNY